MFRDSDVLKLHPHHWIAGPGYLTVFLPTRALSIHLSGAEAKIWELIDGQDLSVGEIIAAVSGDHVSESTARDILQQLASAGLLSPGSALWLHDDSSEYRLGDDPNHDDGAAA